jgi:hypothetical protein
MNRRATSCVLCVIMTVLTGACVSVAAKKGELPLTAPGKELLAAYSDMLTALKTEITASAPTIGEQKKAAFLAAHAAVAAVPPRPNPRGLKSAPPRYAPSHDLYAAAQSNALIAARAILSDVDTFLASDKLDAKLAKCALLVHATPRGLAAFAQQGKEHEALIAALLGDEALIRQIMEMGGAYEGKYGQAMQNYAAVRKVSKRAQEGFFRRWALASSLEHPDGNTKKEGSTAAEVMVEIYLNYEKAYLEGKLDPAFDSYSDFEYRFIFPHRSAEDVTWMREMMRNYRPDHIVMPDYKWRYCRIVRTDVPYTSGVSRPVRPDLGLTAAQDWFLEGGICGPRAFAGKLSTAAFGIPTRGARQTGHAAMSHWTPDGWTTVFGAHWTFNRWRGRCGLDFVLETQARENPEEYMKVLRAQWLGDAFGEASVNAMAYGTGGGLWNALAFYKKLAIVEDSKIAEVAVTGEELGESNVEAEAEKTPQVEIPEADKKITVGRDGAITIPVAACVAPTKSTEKIRFMKSFSGGIQLHYNLAGKRPELIRYAVEVPAAGKYDLTAHVVTVTVDRSLLLRLNRRTLVDVALPYTCGMWKDTKPVTIALKKGKNTLGFTCKSPNKGVTIKHFTLTPAGK